MSQVIANAMITPDGTILQSYHRHDYKTYTDKNGEEYMIDGGTDYCRSNVNKVAPQYITVTMDDIHNLRRKWFHWGTRGKNGDQPLQWKPLKDLDTDHIKAILETQHHIPEYLVELFEDELHFRQEALGEIV